MPFPDRLVLIRHAAPSPLPKRPAAEWPLSAAGVSSCADLASRLFSRGAAHVVSSTEPKAAETAHQVARRLGIEHSIHPGLEEHHRRTVPLLADRASFVALVEAMLAEPDALVFGEETATQACDRFEAAVDRVIAAWRRPGPVCVVAHGTVMSLLAERWTGAPAIETWRQLGLPALVEISLPDRELLPVVSSVEPALDDEALLSFYLKRGAPEARWNLESDSAGIEHCLKRWFESRSHAGTDLEVCNVGIGEGSWDDYLGYYFDGRGLVTSIDVDRDQCDLLRYRQKREGHPSPSTVLALDLLACPIVDRFDVVTIVGSTAHETGDRERALARAARLLRPGGALFYADFFSLHPAGWFRERSAELGLESIEGYEAPELGAYAFWALRRG